ncbi:hypothetical protein I600_492 [Maribacter dokdonensis DSW-8]|nr:hypothetical protein I600_492 [Maribacter dokdonensis DSW-8]
MSLPIFEASSRAETTIALLVTVPVGAGGFSLQLPKITKAISVMANFRWFIVG